MADVNRGNRPLSPHLDIYRLPMSAITSILNRITGNALILAALMIVWWLVALATVPEAFARADGVLRSWFGDLVLFGSVWALWYHMLFGIRHLIWHTGRMLEVEQSDHFAMIAIILSVLLTIFVVVVV